VKTFRGHVAGELVFFFKNAIYEIKELLMMAWDNSSSKQNHHPIQSTEPPTSQIPLSCSSAPAHTPLLHPRFWRAIDLPTHIVIPIRIHIVFIIIFHLLILAGMRTLKTVR
jgi:hypothetical protein